MFTHLHLATTILVLGTALLPQVTLAYTNAQCKSWGYSYACTPASPGHWSWVDGASNKNCACGQLYSSNSGTTCCNTRNVCTRPSNWRNNLGYVNTCLYCSWGSWSSCTCAGTQTRTKPNNCGSETRGCTAYTWLSWSSCSCSSSTRTRSSSRCGKTQTDSCDPFSWSSWSDCSCATQRSTRTSSRCGTSQSRTCDPFAWSSWSSCNCDGRRSRSSSKCNTQSEDACTAPSKSAYGSWSSWSCNAACGSGTAARERSCIPGTCPGSCTAGQVDSEERDCYVTPYAWATWSPWSSCKSDCGPIVAAGQQRSRPCVGECVAAGLSKCTPGSVDASQRACGGASWNPWNIASPCSQSTCGSGQQTWSRSCSLDGTEQESDSRPCVSGAPATWSPWSPRLECATPSAQGKSHRPWLRDCQTNCHGNCSGDALRSGPCTWSTLTIGARVNASLDGAQRRRGDEHTASEVFAQWVSQSILQWLAINNGTLPATQLGRLDQGWLVGDQLTRGDEAMPEEVEVQAQLTVIGEFGHAFMLAFGGTEGRNITLPLVCPSNVSELMGANVQAVTVVRLYVAVPPPTTLDPAMTTKGAAASQDRKNKASMIVPIVVAVMALVLIVVVVVYRRSTRGRKPLVAPDTVPMSSNPLYGDETLGSTEMEDRSTASATAQPNYNHLQHPTGAQASYDRLDGATDPAISTVHSYNGLSHQHGLVDDYGNPIEQGDMPPEYGEAVHEYGTVDAPLKPEHGIHSYGDPQLKARGNAYHPYGTPMPLGNSTASTAPPGYSADNHAYDTPVPLPKKTRGAFASGSVVSNAGYVDTSFPFDKVQSALDADYDVPEAVRRQAQTSFPFDKVQSALDANYDVPDAVRQQTRKTAVAQRQDEPSEDAYDVPAMVYRRGADQEGENEYDAPRQLVKQAKSSSLKASYDVPISPLTASEDPSYYLATTTTAPQRMYSAPEGEYQVPDHPPSQVYGFVGVSSASDATGPPSAMALLATSEHELSSDPARMEWHTDVFFNLIVCLTRCPDSERARRWLQAPGGSGCFLIRPSASGEASMRALSFIDSKKALQQERIHQRADGRFAILNMDFASLGALVEHFCQHDLYQGRLGSKGAVQLQNCCDKHLAYLESQARPNCHDKSAVINAGLKLSVAARRKCNTWQKVDVQAAYLEYFGGDQSLA
ncbi:uncharacterized protein MONBRDRAFT_11892 [Monosiga brevicollis MX1]|uniref:SH2 domain-containing protein n=1 Tax=Monosiga brevicollis TaxID=81824 RepID=A9VAL3_MONBE|nr:uncharacterized protein MONBRDRAFT_11892 [Monosiga brevicollis MX1]EDQ85394.1 predicted protein [Monosiga brevicollis MX1]|eukprot:XP_001749805.1 hypothetical protein [Monosiga brevicollis MX1]